MIRLQCWLPLVFVAGFGCGSNRENPLVVPQAREYMLVPNRGTDRLSLRGLDLSNGSTRELDSAPTGKQPVAARVQPGGKLVFVCNHGDSSLSVYAVDPVQGRLQALATVAAPASPTLLTVHPSGRFVYAAGGSQLQGYRVTPEGGLEPLAGATVSLSQPATLSATWIGDVLHLPLQQAVLSLAVDESSGIPNPLGLTSVGEGALVQVDSHPNGRLLLGVMQKPQGGSIMSWSAGPSGQLSPLTEQNLSFSPGIGDIAANGQLYLGEFGPQGRIHGYQVDSAQGTLRELPESPYPAAGGGVFVALDASNAFAYSAQIEGGASLAEHVRSPNGSLQAVEGSPAGDGLAQPQFFDFLSDGF